MSWQNGVFWPQGSLLFGVQKSSLQDCPKILLHLFEEDTLLFLSVGKLCLKAIYQVVIFVWNLPILCLSKIGGKILKVKLLKIRKILDLLSNRKIVHRNYWLVVFFLLRFWGAQFVTSLIFKRFLSNIWSWACENWSGSLRTDSVAVRVK